MADFNLKVGDRLPLLSAQMLDAEGVAVDLTGATVTFTLRQVGSAVNKVDKVACVIDSIPSGLVSYVWAAADVDTPGQFHGWFEVTVDGKVQTLPAGGFITVDIEGAQTSFVDQRPEVLLDAVDSLVHFIRSAGILYAADAASAYITILDPSGNETVARTQAGITQAGARLTYSRTWDDATFELWEDYVALWEWQVDGVAYSDRQFLDVVRTKLPCQVDMDDLIDMYPDLLEHLSSLGEEDPSKFIRRAWSTLLDRLRSGGSRPSLILDRVRLVNPALELALHMTCNALARSPDDIWDKRSDRHLKMYERLMAGLGTLKYDSDEDALANDGDVVRPNRRTFTV